MTRFEGIMQYKEVSEMGNRALVVFRSKDDCSPGVYLHWNGSPDQIMELLNKVEYLRRGSVGYCAARFCGTCHEALPNKQYSLGLFNIPDYVLNDEKWEDLNDWADDNGTYLVDVNIGSVVQIQQDGGEKDVGRVKLQDY